MAQMGVSGLDLRIYLAQWTSHLLLAGKVERDTVRYFPDFSGGLGKHQKVGLQHFTTKNIIHLWWILQIYSWNGFIKQLSTGGGLSCRSTVCWFLDPANYNQSSLGPPKLFLVFFLGLSIEP